MSMTRPFQCPHSVVDKFGCTESRLCCQCECVTFVRSLFFLFAPLRHGYAQTKPLIGECCSAYCTASTSLQAVLWCSATALRRWSIFAHRPTARPLSCYRYSLIHTPAWLPQASSTPPLLCTEQSAWLRLAPPIFCTPLAPARTSYSLCCS